jgi:molecular chaperone DnaK (HSP70)
MAKSCRRSVGTAMQSQSCWLTSRSSAPLMSTPLDQNQPSLGGCRSFHGTSKQEILPVLAVGALALVGRYSWKAMNRMDEEWEDYQWALQQYERQHRKDQAAADAPLTIGVDLGTIYLKLSSMGNSDKADLVPTAQGDRYRFTGILMDKSVDGGEDTMIIGRPALDKFFYSPESSSLVSSVVLPYRELQKASHDDATKLVQQVVLPTVGEALEQMATSISQQQEQEGQPKTNVRTVLTVPPVFFNQHREKIFNQNYHDGSHHTITVPDPVAAIWGAQSVNLLPTPSSKEEIATTSILVVDIGGLASSVSLVRQDRVIGTSCLDNVGGESYVQQLSERVLKETGDASIGQDVMSLALIHSSARSSILELVQKTSSKVHIPFLFMGRKDKADEPHFEMTISRTVMDQAVQDYWTKSVVPKLLEDGELSASLPPPTNASSLLTSAITKVLEESGELPTNIQHILLVGGGSKFKLFEQALQDGISALMGPSANKMVIPEASLRAELTTMGAAAMLPNYDYNYDRGLERVDM